MSADTRTALFTSGTIGLFVIQDTGPQAPDPNYSVSDPSTWGAISGDLASGDPAVLNTMIARYTLKPPEDVYDGLVADATTPTGYKLIKDASEVNRGSVSTSSGNQTDAFLLFREDPSPNDFLNVTSPGAPPGYVKIDEGFFGQYRQSEVPGQAEITGTDLLYLNAIAGLLGGYGNLGGAGTAFATALGVNLTDYSADFAVGDFVESFDTIPSNRGELKGIRPGLQVEARVAPVPEPASLALLGTGIVGLLGYRRRKTRS